MAKTTKPFLYLYKKWGKAGGELPTEGLCNSIGYLNQWEAWRMVIPTIKEKNRLFRDKKPWVYWGRESYGEGNREFTALRQTIMLLAACLNDEL